MKGEKADSRKGSEQAGPQQRKEKQEKEDSKGIQSFKKEADYFKHLCRSIGFHKEIHKTSQRARKTKKEKPTFVKQFFAQEPDQEAQPQRGEGAH